ncbi:PIN domain-containing protein [Pyrodictium abyssi]|uniref:PIN domain-containing protein n=1 Tax=Pyrodictium abyssi TaxID=54256 RepID=A0ABM8J124_9CREN|nr:hypothetical protein PABY_23690 [Pyrodictium abyssi]
MTLAARESTLIGLDTNILVYALDSLAGEKHSIAVDIMEDMLLNPDKYAISIQNFSELVYVVKRKLPSQLGLAIELIEAIAAAGVRILYYTPAEVIQAARYPRKRFWEHAPRIHVP